MIATAMSAAIIPYSMAVAPDSSLRSDSRNLQPKIQKIANEKSRPTQEQKTDKAALRQ
jgi:hypothetical protein